MEVLDKNGLEHFWGNAKEYVDSNKTTSYSPLTDKPKINNVELSGNKTLTDIGVQQTVISETEPVDNSVQVWINPTSEGVFVPSKTSDLTNDSGFITKDVNNLTNYTKTNDLNIPTATSQLTNDSGFTTKSYVDGLVGNINSVLATLTEVNN